MTEPMDAAAFGRLMASADAASATDWQAATEILSLPTLAALVSLGVLKPIAEPAPVPARSSSSWWDPERRYHAPDDLPPVGAWLGARTPAGELIGRFHQFYGWNDRVGALTIGCNRFRSGSPIANAYHVDGRLKLEVVDDGPPAEACQKCLERGSRADNGEDATA